MVLTEPYSEVLIITPFFTRFLFFIFTIYTLVEMISRQSLKVGWQNKERNWNSAKVHQYVSVQIESVHYNFAEALKIPCVSQSGSVLSLPHVINTEHALPALSSAAPHTTVTYSCIYVTYLIKTSEVFTNYFFSFCVL